MTPIERTVLEAHLVELEAALASSPTAVDLLFARACALDSLGKAREARHAYRNVIQVQPDHFDALTGLGALLARMGDRAGARDALRQGLGAQPNNAYAHANLATLVADDDQAKAVEHYRRAVGLDPSHLNAHRGLAILLLRRGEVELARHHGRIGFNGQPEVWPFRGAGSPVSVLLVHSALGGNAPIDAFIDDATFEKWTWVAEFSDPRAPFPPCDFVFNTIGDADKCAFALEAAGQVLARGTPTVLNPPRLIGQTGRVANSERLRSVPGVMTARMVEWPRNRLAAADAPKALAAAGFVFPLLLRSPGFQTGEHFVKVHEPAQLEEAVQALPGDPLLAIEFLNTLSADGKHRKYRVMMIDGQLYPLHLAISTTWKVHYFSADMADSPAHRAEDEAFLQDMPRVLGPKAMKTLERIQKLVGLNYGGIDFTLDGSNNVIVFEANATMAIVSPGDDERWRYRAQPVARVQKAVRQMLMRRGLQAQPDNAYVHANLAALLADENQAQAIDHYRRAVSLDPSHLDAHRGLAVLLLRRGELEPARHHGRIGFTGQAEVCPFRGSGTPVSVLLVQSALEGNAPIDAFIDDATFEKWTWLAEFSDPRAPFPPCDVVFNTIGDADKCAFALEAAGQVLARRTPPVLNPPGLIGQTGRVANSERLRNVPGVVTARMVEWPRNRVAAADAPNALAAAGFVFPLLLRAPGFQTGEHFVKVDEPGRLEASVQTLPGDSLLIIEFLSTVSADGKLRKYRVMMIDGQLYPLHLAISTRWKVHYFSADMADSPAHRAEDEAFLQDMPGVLGPKAVQALERIQELVGLDYGGIDFALDSDGNVVVFEVNATMRIPPPGDDERWRYRSQPVARAQNAVRQMITRRATPL